MGVSGGGHKLRRATVGVGVAHGWSFGAAVKVFCRNYI